VSGPSGPVSSFRCRRGALLLRFGVAIYAPAKRSDVCRRVPIETINGYSMRNWGGGPVTCHHFISSKARRKTPGPSSVLGKPHVSPLNSRLASLLVDLALAMAFTDGFGNCSFTTRPANDPQTDLLKGVHHCRFLRHLSHDCVDDRGLTLDVI